MTQVAGTGVDVPARRHAIAETLRLRSETIALRDLLTRRVDGWDLVIERLEAGVPGANVIDEGGPQARAELTDALEAFETQRNAWRTAMFRLMLEEGTTITDASELFGFTRQFGARIARKARVLVLDEH